MKIEKAIEFLDAILESGEYLGEPDDSKALKLGIEALKGIKKVRRTLEPYVTALLPGETEK